MAKQTLFSSSRSIYWPGEFADLVNILKGLDQKGLPGHDGLYRYNTGPIVLAACIGFAKGRERDVGGNRQEISTDTFEAHRIGNGSMASFVLLIPLMGTGDIELLRPEREDDLVRKFERYVAGGFEYLRGAMSVSADSTGITVIRTELQTALAEGLARQLANGATE